MKYATLLASLAAFAVQPVFAAVEMNYYCSSRPDAKHPRNTIRYDYSEGDEVSVELYRAKGVNQKEFNRLLRQTNTVELDAGMTDSVIKHLDKLAAVGCLPGGGFTGCRKTNPRAAIVANSFRAESQLVHGLSTKSQHIVETVTYAEGTKLTLDVRNQDDATDGNYTGTLAISSKDRRYRKLPPNLKISCYVSTP